ncbi:SDR family oxidoreductase [Dactylosporangium matsuzakiense]|uniref:3-oxoacyl-ACP reductase n=1 Tax=Dactylosporangium matsuzakiense TaxID=53360 RepID=A0A9W6KJG7_9ACTN|nr:SDR family oxidoreductase [Dactylosporangium matsuzakiense]GLL02107.1 3-oxoacyl-ACP reductase [Dactylosporangium matsuzakiense]
MTDGVQGGLAGRVVVVTGGTRGIGRATSELLARAGAAVVLTGRDELETERAAAELSAAGAVPVTGAAFDVADFDAVSAAFKAIAARHGRIDGLVANAGVSENAVIGMITPRSVERLLATNVAGTIFTVQAAARIMMRRGAGSIVVLASVVGEHGSAGQTAYAASKAAAATVARSASKELGPRGIRVNAVAPGLIDTEMTARIPEAVVEARLADTALRRLGDPVDVARVIRFLISDEAAFVTGQVLGVDGGLVL